MVHKSQSEHPFGEILHNILVLLNFNEKVFVKL
jgi:hypothetical protein